MSELDPAGLEAAAKKAHGAFTIYTPACSPARLTARRQAAIHAPKPSGWCGRIAPGGWRRSSRWFLMRDVEEILTGLRAERLFEPLPEAIHIVNLADAESADLIARRFPNGGTTDG